MPPRLGSLTSTLVADSRALLAGPVAAALAAWPYVDEVGVVEIDPELADTAAMSRAYDVPLAASANCVVVSGRRDGIERVAACVVRADTRADVNTLVKRSLDVRKASFLPMDRAVEETGMEYGGITPVGLPVGLPVGTAPADDPADGRRLDQGWRLFVDAACLEIEVAVIGSGVRRSKLLLPGRRLADLPGAEVLTGLGRAP